MPTFSDESVGVVEFKSAWRHERRKADAESQTRTLKISDNPVQTVYRDDVGMQTETDVKDYQLVEEDDPVRLAEFLRRVEPMLSTALRRNAKSTAFDGYLMSSHGVNDCTNTHTLSHSDLTDQFSVTSLSWSSTGSIIAASFGKFDHDDWCVHKTNLCTWNLNKTSGMSTKAAVTIDVPCCLMSVAFHPTEPALIAGGNFNGELMVWDMSREADMLIASSSKTDDSHNEPISKVIWYQMSGRRRIYHVISVSSDGKMLIWKLDKDKGRLTIDSGFLLLASNMPKSVRVKSSKKNAEMGVTSVSFNCLDETVFYVGAESGGIFKCSTSSQSTPMGGEGDITLYNPVTFKFQTHKGPVYAVSANPFHRNLFATCSSDTTLRLHNALQAEPILVLDPAEGYLYSARWSYTRPLVLAVATQAGSLLLYDFKQSNNSPVHRLQLENSTQPVYTVEFNQKQQNLIACGDASGTIRVWKLPDSLTVETGSERAILEQLADTSGQE